MFGQDETDEAVAVLKEVKNQMDIRVENVDKLNTLTKEIDVFIASKLDSSDIIDNSEIENNDSIVAYE